MQEFIDKMDVEQYLTTLIAGATNVVLAILILIIGLFIANKVNCIIYKTGEKYENLDNALFRFLGNLGKYIILGFVAIAALNRFGIQTASIVALLGAAGLQSA